VRDPVSYEFVTTTAADAYLSPEDRARVLIDQKLAEAGWVVQSRDSINLYAGRGVAIREFIHRKEHGRSDYALFVDRRLCGVIEAKPAGTTLTEVEAQTKKYVTGAPNELEVPWEVLPFGYEATGEESRFTCFADPEPKSRQFFDGYFHRPETFAGFVEAIENEGTLRSRLRLRPQVDTRGLWTVQVEAIKNLEESLAANRQRGLIQMATGSGKTFTAANLCYRLIQHAGAQRVLFLVDRNNLGIQARGEFQGFTVPGTNRKFTDVYNIQRLTGATIDRVSRICISTVQRMYSILTGEELPPELDEISLDDLVKPPAPVAYNGKVPPDTFDILIIDECHRSIFGTWRQVVEYFDAFLVGLTATPNKQALGFFNQNLVMEYSHDRAVADKVSVDYTVYRIRTEITEKGSKVEAGLEAGFRSRQTRKVRWETVDADVVYPAKELDRSVVAKDQMRTVIRTFKEKLFTEIFPPEENEPPRTTVPKTLIFAKDDSHADDIVDIVRDEFGKGNDFCEKITYRTVGKDPESLIKAFRNSPELRVVVTVDMIATGTDVKPIECLLFMRDVYSHTYYEQMLGRGVRIINEADFRSVTPDAHAKEGFVVVDAVGVTERDRFNDITQPLDRKPTISLDKLMNAVAQGNREQDIASTLAGRLARLDRRMTSEDRERVKAASGGTDLTEITHRLVDAIDPDRHIEEAIQATGKADPTVAEVEAARRALTEEALRPLASNPGLRTLLVDLRRSYEQVIDDTSKDVVLFAGHTKEARDRAREDVEAFREYLDEHRGEIRALQVLYSRPYKERLTYRDIKELANALARTPNAWTPDRLWQAYAALDKSKVRGSGERMLTDIVSLVQYALQQEGELVPFGEKVDERFTAWLAMQEQTGSKFTSEQRRWLGWMKDYIASAAAIDADAFDLPPFTEHGGLGRAVEVFGDRLQALMADLSDALAA
jgi:type I restriction enzyme R subunit